MIVLIPVYTYHPVTKEKEGKTISMINLNPSLIQEIEKDEETGKANIIYLNGRLVSTAISFEKAFSLYHRIGQIALDFAMESAKVDKEFDAYKRYNGI